MSFDALLNGLLERKRDLGRRMLIPPVDLKRDEAWFAENLTRVEATPPQFEEVDVEEIDRMEPQRFERWALQRMSALGYVADRTPRSYDAGADGLLVHRKSSSRVIVQCKHKRNVAAPCGDDPVDDLLRARTAYGDGPVRLVALTNAIEFTEKARRRANDHVITLVARDELLRWPAVAL
jgi:HJR/Mrr/RecB family endonuclease